MDDKSNESDEDSEVGEMDEEEQRAHAEELLRRRRELVRNLRNRRRRALQVMREKESQRELEIVEREQEINVIETRRKNRRRSSLLSNPNPNPNPNLNETDRQRAETREERAQRILEETSDDDDGGWAAHTMTLNVAMFQRMRDQEAAKRELRQVREDISRVQQKRKGKVDDLQDKKQLYNRFLPANKRDGGDKERLRIIRVLTTEINQLQERSEELQIVLRRIEYEFNDTDEESLAGTTEKGGEGEDDEDEEEEEAEDLHVTY